MYPNRLTILTLYNEDQKSKQRTSAEYELQRNLYAIQGKVPAICQSAILISIEEGRLTICTGNPDELPSHVDRNTIVPVYLLLPEGPFAVPTGRILIRFKDFITASNQKDKLDQIGYIIDQEIEYAPHAVWVKAKSGDLDQTLNNINQLTTLADIQHIEPQMLMPVSKR